jgi:hypothetical protein
MHWRIAEHWPTFRYRSAIKERFGDDALNASHREFGIDL